MNLLPLESLGLGPNEFEIGLKFKFQEIIRNDN